jgi:hypothetical protein
MTKFDHIRQSLIGELDHRRTEIERGDMNWFSIKVTLKHGYPRATFQCEQECTLEDKKANETWR